MVTAGDYRYSPKGIREDLVGGRKRKILRERSEQRRRSMTTVRLNMQRGGRITERGVVMPSST